LEHRVKDRKDARHEQCFLLWRSYLFTAQAVDTSMLATPKNTAAQRSPG